MGYKPVFQLAYKLQGPLRTVNRPELLWTLKPGKIFDIADCNIKNFPGFQSP